MDRKFNLATYCSNYRGKYKLQPVMISDCASSRKLENLWLLTYIQSLSYKLLDWKKDFILKICSKEKQLLCCTF